MRRRFNFIEPESLISVVVTLVILSVGVFAFFTTMSAIKGPTTENTTNSKTMEATISNITGVGNSVFNIMGVVLIIGAMMAVLGLVYSYVGGIPATESEPRIPKRKIIDEPEPEEIKQIEALEPDFAEKLRRQVDSGEITATEYNERMINHWYKKK